MLHEAEPHQTISFKSIMGKGLNLKKDGTYVAFVAGTGVLTFIDLVAILIR